jgi:phosphate transport system permease protein
MLILGWLIVWSIPGWSVALNWHGQHAIYPAILATIYVTVLAVPIAAFFGIFAAIAISDARIFGPAVTNVRAAISIMGSIPTVISAFTAATAVVVLGQQPTLTLAGIALAFINMPLMTALASNVIAGGSQRLREAATALGASPTFVVRVFLPGATSQLGAAVLLVVTQIIGGAAVIALVDGVMTPRGFGWAPLSAWPLAVNIWAHATDATRIDPTRYGVTAAGTIILTVVIWLLQGAAQLRVAPATGGKRGS